MSTTRRGTIYSLPEHVFRTPTLVQTQMDTRSLLSKSMALEDEAHGATGHADDSEGAELSSRPPSPISHSSSRVSRQLVQAGTTSSLSPKSTTCIGDVDFPCNAKLPPTQASSPTSLASPSLPVVDVAREKGLIEERRAKFALARRKRSKRIDSATNNAIDVGYRPRPSAVERYLSQLPSVKTSLNAQALRTAGAGAYIGQKINRKKKIPWTLEQLLQKGFTIHEWNGRDPEVVVDTEGRILIALAGRPPDPSWEEAISGVTNRLSALEKHGIASGTFKLRDSKHRRGNYLAVARGVSFGGGQRKPGNLVHSRKRRELLHEIINDHNVLRIAGFQSSTIAFYAPKVYEYLRDTMKKLFDHHPGLVQNFRNSVFPAITLNCGPETTCAEHEDSGNAANMFCSITALGQYNPKTGGHFVVFPLKLIIEFPPGSTIDVPSATVAHGNTPIMPGEIRMSITQYCAGGLLRWVDYGFRTAKSVLAQAGGQKVLDEIHGEAGTRWSWALGLFSKADGLKEDQIKVFGKKMKEQESTAVQV